SLRRIAAAQGLAADKAQRWAAAHGGRACASAAEAADGAEVLALCVGNDHDVEANVRAALDYLAPGAVIADHTTTSATLAERMAVLASVRGLSFVDAPVSGGQAGAQNGQLTIMCGGMPDAFAKVEPVLKAYAKKIALIGPSGSGQKAKMVNQICIAGVVQGLAEGLAFAQASGLDVRAVIEVISQGAAQSWQMQNRWETMAARDFNFGFAVDHMRKDLGICLDAARVAGARLPVTALVDQFYADIQAMGGQQWDTSSLIARLSPSSKL
ncbi:MAG TPA: oxidoreductase, partial [Alphaproteobacteria bacterium]|nr:oxidoreductase [Alphaproteobacteria bacterium]